MIKSKLSEFFVFKSLPNEWIVLRNKFEKQLVFLKRTHQILEGIADELF